MIQTTLDEFALKNIVRVYHSSVASFNRYRDTYDREIFKHPLYKHIDAIEHIIEDRYETVIGISKRTDSQPIREP